MLKILFGLVRAFIIIVIYKRISAFVRNIYTCSLQRGFYFLLFIGHVTVDQDTIFKSAS